MASSKRQKPLKERRRDRLSELPDHVISHILSFLPIIDAISSSFLSTKFRFLWNYITCIDLDTGSLDDIIYEEEAVFVVLVNWILFSLKQPILRAFRLKDEVNYFHRNLQLWIDVLVSRRIEELDLAVNGTQWGREFDLMRKSLLNSTTIVVLKLKGPFVVKILTKNISLPSLRTLHLVRLGYENHDTVRKLLAGCPVLENLVVRRLARWDGLSCFDISCPLLKNLDIQAGTDYEDDDNNGYFICSLSYDPDFLKLGKYEINTPSLKYMKIKDNMSMKLKFKDVSSLVAANLDIWGDGKDSVVYHLLRGLSHVKYLSLSKNTMQMLAAISPFPAPKLNNLKKLKVEMKKKSKRARKVIQQLTRYSKKLEEISYIKSKIQ